MTSITCAVASFKDQPDALIDGSMVEHACQRIGHLWRDRLLDPVTTLRLFVLQVLHGNVACRTLGHLSSMRFSPTAYCKARARLPIELFEWLVADLIDAARRQTNTWGRWCGHRVYWVDGTGVSMPDTPALQDGFGQPARVRPGCGFPVMHVLWMFDAATGLIIDLAVGRWDRHDIADVAALHPKLAAGDVIVGDRGLCSYAHLALVLQKNLHAVLRLHQKVITDFHPGRRCRSQSPKSQRAGKPTSRYVKKLGSLDQSVQYVKPRDLPRWMSAAQYALLPSVITVRELRYCVSRPGFRSRQVTLVTTLLDPHKYPKETLARLYRSRWQIETNLRHLKQTMNHNVLRCKSRDGVLKELWVYVLVYNHVRMRMLQAAKRQGVKPDRISFIDALDELRYRAPTDPLLTLMTNPSRERGAEPRVIKRPRDRYTYLTKPRDKLRQALGIKQVDD